jgi:hypothetical protein
MASAKDIIVKPIKASAANDLVKRVHYSGKVVPNSQLHFGVFFNGKLEGAMSFGPPINKKGTINIVKDTQWNGMLELNRMAFSDILPRNSESRAMAVAFKLIKKHYPHIEWVVSFSDGTQCGDGTIYRAAGFVLTDIRESDALRVNPETGEVMHVIQAHHLMLSKQFRSWKPTKGYQLRYVYFINKDARNRLTVPVLPFSKIDEMGAGMYKGRPKRITKANSGDQSESGGAVPTDALQSSKPSKSNNNQENDKC